MCVDIDYWTQMSYSNSAACLQCGTDFVAFLVCVQLLLLCLFVNAAVPVIVVLLILLLVGLLESILTRPRRNGWPQIAVHSTIGQLDDKPLDKVGLSLVILSNILPRDILIKIYEPWSAGESLRWTMSWGYCLWRNNNAFSHSNNIGWSKSRLTYRVS